MRAKTQSLHLSKMMQKYKPYPEYELVLPFFLVKKNSLKKLLEGDVFLLGESHLSLNLLKDDELCGNVDIEESENSRKIKIININKHMSLSSDSKKYEKIKCSFDFLQSRVFEVGHKIDISSIDLEKVNLFLGKKKIAKGILVNVDEEIAIEITKVSV